MESKKTTTSYQRKRRLIALLLLLIFLFQPISQATNEIVYVANEIQESKVQEVVDTTEEFSYPQENKENGNGGTAEEKEVPKEILEKKPDLIKQGITEEGEKVEVDKYSVTYKTGENTYKKVISPVPNTYTDETGKEQEIDNTLVSTDTNIFDNSKEYTNNKNSFKVTLPEEIKENNSITIEENNKSIELVPVDGDFTNSVVLENAIRYNNVFDGIDFQYTVNNAGLKEDIILNKYVEKNEYEYELKLQKGLTAKKESSIVNIYNGEERIYTIEAPMMQDANGEISFGINIEIEEREEKYFIKVTADKEWIAEPERVYPIKIDPTISSTQALDDTLYFTTVEEYAPNLELGNVNYTYVGYDNGKATGTSYGTGGTGHGITRIYTMLDVSSIPSEAVINSATYTVYQRSTFYKRSTSTGIRMEMALYSVGEDWKGKKSWNNQPFDGQEFIDSKQVLDATGYIEYNIRDLVNDWVRGIKVNKGMCLRAISENTMQCEWIGSTAAGASNPTYAPRYEITYTVQDPVDENLPLNDLTINLRVINEKDSTGKLRFNGVFLDGVSKPNTIVGYWSDPDIGGTGTSYSSYSYKYPNSEEINNYYPDSNKYKDKTSNWQSQGLFTNFEFNKLYTFYARATDGVNVSDNKQSDSFIIYKVKQRDTIPYIANYYGVPASQIMKDNRVQDTLLVENNTLFIRNPKQNVDKPYTPAELTDKQKQEIDGALRGRNLHCEYGYEPINLNTGNFYMAKTDASISDLEGYFEINRTYNSKAEGYNSAFGRNWDFEYAESLSKLEDGTIIYSKGNGQQLFFKQNGQGGYVSPYGTELELVENQYEVTVDENIETRINYTITDKSTKEVRQFNSYGLLTKITDLLGNETKIEYTEELKISKIVSPTGKVYDITMDNTGKITKITLPNGGILQYEYDANNNLVKYTNAEGRTETYQYDENYKMTSWVDGNGNQVVKNEYDSEGRVTKQYNANGDCATLTYEDGKTISTDNNGNTTVYYYNDRGYTTKIEYPDGGVIEKTYDNKGNLVTETDVLGNVTKYEYDANSNLVKQIRADGAEKTISYNSLNKITKIVDFDGKTTSYEYDNKGNVTKETNNAGIVTTYQYDELNRLVKAIDGKGNTTEYDYDGANITSVTNRLGQVTKIYYNSMNQVTAIENPKGEISRVVYNLAGDKVTEQLADSTQTIYSYDAGGRLVTITDAKGNVTKFEYNSVDSVVKAIDAVGNETKIEYDKNQNKTKETDGENRTVSYQYDSMNRITKVIDANGNATTVEYDKAGNITKVTDANGNETTYKYNTVLNKVVEEITPLGNTTKLEYDLNGNLVKVISEENLVTTYKYDNLNRLVEEVLPTGEITTYSYDENNNIVKIQDNSDRAYTYEYDKENRLVKTINPLGHTEQYIYDLAGNVEKIIDVAGDEINYQYDAVGRLQQIKYQEENTYKFKHDVNGNIVESIDANGNVSKKEYDAIDRVTSEIDATGSITKYEYDKVSNVVKTIDALNGTTIYGYNNAGQITEVTDANGNKYTLEYDKLGNNTKVIDALGNETTLEYDKENKLVKTTSSEGLVTQYEYNKLGQVTKVYDNANNQVIYTYENTRVVKQEDIAGRTIEYKYDLAGNVIEIKNYDDTITKYEYDKLDRLTKVTDAEGNTTEFTYDTKGNVITKKEDDQRIWQYEYDRIGNILKETNPEKATTKYEYDKNSNLLKIVNANGTEKTYTYDALNRITSITDENSNTTTVSYDALSRIIGITKPEGGKTEYLYDAVGNLIKEKDELENITTYEYDAMQNLRKIISPKGAVTQYEYNTLGDVIKTTDALGNITTNKLNLNGQIEEITQPNGAKYSYQYDVLQRLTKVQAPEGLERTLVYDLKDNLIEEIDANGNSTKYTYDIMHRLIGVTNANENKEIYEYDNRGNLKSFTNTKGVKTEYTYDVLDRLNSTIDATGLVTTFEYDTLGNLTKQDRSGGRITTYQYDNVSNITKVTNALNNSTSYEYNKESNLTKQTDALGLSTIYGYDLKGQLTKVTDAKNNSINIGYDAHGNISEVKNQLGNSKKYEYDLLDRLTSVENEKGIKTNYEYDAVGNLTKTINGNGNVTEYSYDALGRITGETGANGKTTAYSYDAVGNIKEITKADGNKITYDYDKINQLVKKEYSKENEGIVLYTYNEDGTRKTMEDNLGTTNYEYDNAGRITKVTIQDGKKIEYKYDDLSRLSELVYPDGKSVKYEYDVLDRLTTVTDRDGGKITYEYNARDELTKTTRANLTYTLCEYNELGQLIKIQNRTSKDEEISTFEYEYDNAGQIIKETARNNGKTITRTFGYDVTGELISCVELDNNILTETIYAYDNAGNRISVETKVGQTIVSENYKYNQAEQLISKTSGDETTEYLYDANGNLISEVQNGQTTRQYGYDTEDRLKAVIEGKNILIGAIYDGDGERVFSLGGKSNQKYVGNKHTGNNKDGHKHDNCAHKNNFCTEEIYFPYTSEEATSSKYELTEYINDVTSEYTQVLAEYGTKKNSLQATYTYGINRESYNNNSTTSYYQYDGRGSVVNLYGQKKKDMVSYSYSPYGEQTVTGKTSNPYGYNGEYTDANTGLQYLRARYYDSSIGRFITKDTYAGNIYNPITQNRYTYAGNNPVNNIDPSGHSILSLIKNTINVVKGVKTAYKVVTNTLPKNNVIRRTAESIAKTLTSLPAQLTNNFAVGSVNNIDQEIQKYVSQYNASNDAGHKERLKKKIEILEQQRKNLCDVAGKAQAKLSDMGVSNVAVIPNKADYVLSQITDEDRINYLNRQAKEANDELNKIFDEHNNSFRTKFTNFAYDRIEDIVGGGTEFLDATVGNALCFVAGVGTFITGNGYEIGARNFRNLHINPVKQDIRDFVNGGEEYDKAGIVGQAAGITLNIFNLVKSIGSGIGSISNTGNAISIGADGSAAIVSGTNITVNAGSAIEMATNLGITSESLSGNGGNSSENETSKVDAENLEDTQTVKNDYNQYKNNGEGRARPYIDNDATTLLKNEIMKGSTPVKDKILRNGLRWDTPGSYNGSEGIWELVIDLDTNRVTHFLFTTKK